MLVNNAGCVCKICRFKDRIINNTLFDFIFKYFVAGSLAETTTEDFTRIMNVNARFDFNIFNFCIHSQAYQDLTNYSFKIKFRKGFSVLLSKASNFPTIRLDHKKSRFIKFSDLSSELVFFTKKLL